MVCTDRGGSLASQLHVLQRGQRLPFVPGREVQVDRRTLGFCTTLKHTGNHHSLRGAADDKGEEKVAGLRLCINEQ